MGWGLARGPGHGAAAEEVDVEVGDGFAAVGAVVHHEAEAVIEVELVGDFGGDEEEVADEGLVGGGGLGEAGDGFFGDDEDVDGGLGVDVAKGVADIVLINGGAGDFAVNDALEEGFVGHGEEEVGAGSVEQGGRKIRMTKFE